MWLGSFSFYRDDIMKDDQTPPRVSDLEEEGEDRTLAKLEALMVVHQRFVADFQKSLEQSGNFIALASKAMEEEPAETKLMLQQVLQTGVLSTLQQIKGDFDVLVAFAHQAGLLDEDADWRVALNEVSEGYTGLLDTAIHQEEEIGELLARLTAQ